MNNKIKVGDTVRVSEDAPRMYVIGFNHFFKGVDSIVKEVEDGNAIIKYSNGTLAKTLAIPTKYLVKVDAEAKEPKFKKGDRVRSKGYGLTGIVLGVDGEYIAVRRDDGIKQEWRISMTDVVLPTEQTEAEEDARIRQMEAELDEFRKAELDRVLHPEKYHTYEVTVDNMAVNWQRYEADLAKDLAVQMVKCNRNNYDKIGNMAVRVAKSVVENLKKK